MFPSPHDTLPGLDLWACWVVSLAPMAALALMAARHGPHCCCCQNDLPAPTGPRLRVCSHQHHNGMGVCAQPGNTRGLSLHVSLLWERLHYWTLHGESNPCMAQAEVVLLPRQITMLCEAHLVGAQVALNEDGPEDAVPLRSMIACDGSVEILLRFDCHRGPVATRDQAAMRLQYSVH